ncbi:MAG: CotH kinase family protein, partial [Gemmiger sp.]
KNTVIVIKRQPDNRYRLYHTVWDLDYTFGDTWTADSFSRTYFRPEDGELPPNTPMYVRCLKDDPESVQALSIQKWKSWNDAGITAEYLCNLADSEMEFLLKSGAFQRDSERWPECQNSSDLTQLKAWIQSRFSTLNRYFSQLGS